MSSRRRPQCYRSGCTAPASVRCDGCHRLSCAYHLDQVRVAAEASGRDRTAELCAACAQEALTRSRRGDPSRATSEASKHALTLWRAGWERAKDDGPESSRTDYAAAIGAVTAQLAPYTTLAALVAAYHASPPALAAALERAMFPASGRVLNYGTIEDAAYWCRARQLLAATDSDDADHAGM
jgi:hypothetical protein